MLMVKNISEYGISVMTSEFAGQGRPYVLYLKPGKFQYMLQDQLKVWPHGGKQDLAAYVQKGVLEVKELSAVHVATDESSTPTFASNDLATALTDAVIIRDNYNAHIGNTAFHTAVDAANVSVLAPPTTLPLLIAFITDLQGKYDAHILLAIHPTPDAWNPTAAGVPIDLPTSLVALRELFALVAQHKEQKVTLGAALTPQQIITY